MTRQKYTITKDDFYTAHQWIEKKFNSTLGWPHPDETARYNAFDRFREITAKATIKSAEELNEWCEMNLKTSDWSTMKTTIRARRSRTKMDSGSKKQITLDAHAHLMLDTIAKAENVTLSRVIEKHLQRQYMKVIGSDAGLQKDALDKPDR